MFSVKFGITLPIAVVAFTVGAFAPYFYLKGKIEDINSKVDSFIEYVKSNNQRNEGYQPVTSDKIKTNILSEKASEVDVMNQKYNNSVAVQINDSTNL